LKKIHMLAACGALIAQQASALVIYKDQATFEKVRPDYTKYIFPFPGDPSDNDTIVIPSPYVTGPLSVSSPLLVQYADFGEYISGHGGITVSASGAYAIAFTYGSFFSAENVEILIGDKVVAIDPYVDIGPSAFIGFTSTTPITSVTFRGGDENDLYEVFVSPSVPEPASWLLMISGFGLAGAALRRRNYRAGGVAVRFSG